MLATKNTYIQSAYKTLQVISQDDQKRMEYEAREKAIWDYNQGMLEAEQRGEERGREEGIQFSTERINRLNALLLQNKRYDDLERSTEDTGFQQQLMSEYNI